MKKAGNIFLAVLLFSLVRTGAFAQSAGNKAITFPDIDGDPKAYAFNLKGTDGRNYSWIDLAEISLWASGAENAAASLEQIQKIAAAIQASPELPLGGREKAEFILSYLHKNIFKSYSLNQTRIDTLLQGGRFNCVSSAALYMILCKSAGIEVTGVVTKDHAFAAVHLNGAAVDVETTNPYGFDPGSSRKEFTDQFGKVTGFAYVPARNYRERQEISSIELVSLVFWNRISLLEAGNRYAEAIPLAIGRAILLNGESLSGGGGHLFEDPHKSLMDRLFNYGSSLLKSGKEDEALAWAALASTRYHDEDRWQEFIFAAANNRLNKYVKAGKTNEARVFLDGQKPALSPANYAQLDKLLVDTEIAGMAGRIRGAEDGDNVLAAVEEARAKENIGEKRATELINFTVLKTASLLSAAPKRDWLAAITFMERAVSRYGSNPELEQALQSYRGNRAADFHNRFAAAWNGKKFDEARLILEEGLAEFPEDRRLLADMEAANKRQ